jgi:hypothetical protein
MSTEIKYKIILKTVDIPNGVEFALYTSDMPNVKFGEIEMAFFETIMCTEDGDITEITLEEVCNHGK